MDNTTSPRRTLLHRIFVPANGTRPGRSLVIFLTLYSVLTISAQFAFAIVPVLRNWAASQPLGAFTPLGQMAFTGLELVILLISVTVMSLIEKRSFRDYGLSQPRTSAKNFLPGLAVGFGMSSALIGLIALYDGYLVRGIAIHGAEIATNALLYGIGFLMVAFFEEFAFRGYMQATLQRGIGFWPAAIVLSLAFGAVHLPNLGGAWTAALVAAAFGLVAAYSVRRTGSLWFILGVHAAFDWSNTFLYSTPIAGLSARGQLLNASLQGPAWLTGGAAGPVGSCFALLVMALAGVFVHFNFPRQQSTLPVEGVAIGNRHCRRVSP